MKRILAVMLALLLCLNALPVSFAASSTVTVLMYMCGTDLQSDCLKDISEMCAANLGTNVRVVVLAGGAKTWSNNRLTARRNNLFTIENGGMSRVTDWGSDSMGAASTLQRFVTYGWQNYRSDRTILVLWDHGGGTAQGMCFDEVHGDDCLTMAEIDSALAAVRAKDASFKLDIFGCDACLMAGYEMAAVASTYADWFVASEELEPSYGWYYTPWLNALAANPAMPTREVCVSIVDSYQDYMRSHRAEEYCTLSAIDLSAFRLFMTDMEVLANHLSAALDNGQLATFTRILQRSYALGSFEAADGDYDMFDIGVLLDIAQQIAPEAAAAARAHLKSAVAYSYATSDVPSPNGLAVYIPLNSAASYLREIAAGYALSSIPQYVSFVKNMVSRIGGSSYTFTTTAPSYCDP